MVVNSIAARSSMLVSLQIFTRSQVKVIQSSFMMWTCFLMLGCEIIYKAIAPKSGSPSRRGVEALHRGCLLGWRPRHALRGFCTD